MSDFLRALLPAPLQISWTERLRACGGALFGLFMASLATRLVVEPNGVLPLLLAPMGASAVLLFGVPASPLAQPWPMLGGNVISAVVGIACAKWIPDALFAAPVAVAAAVGIMLALRCLHPPGGAVALLAATGGPAVQGTDWAFAINPVGVNSVLLLLAAIVFNNLAGRRYPHGLKPAHNHQTQDPTPAQRLGFSTADLDAVLRRHDQLLDVARADLESLFQQAEMESYHRRLGEMTCAEIMSRDVAAVEFGTPLQEAWTLLRRRRVSGLPVLDRARRVIGIVTLADFVKHPDLDCLEGLRGRLSRFLRPAAGMFSEKPEVVGQIMAAPVRTIGVDAHVVALVPLMAAGLHQLPVIDQERRLAGMVAQSDLVAALYRGRLAEADGPGTVLSFRLAGSSLKEAS
ncbi:HPP family protein [Dankookia rubra]|uniref:HPP family protein n=1 Tax=Dankookia rubra TaxID=1442381 RepID=UPI0019D5BC54|nr:HPP family protein [Dankookia rubra]